MSKRSKRHEKSRFRKIPDLESLKQLNLNAGGIDIGSAEIWVCVPKDCDEESVKMFSTFTIDLHEIATWLLRCDVDTVAMESTGLYWMPLYDILEQNGIDVYLVNAKEAKNVSGRKTDILDCQWLQQLQTYGLLRKSFIPDKEIRKLRDLGRHRDNLIRHRATQIQYMQKALHLMNLQLDNVITDITGKTGISIIRDIVAGRTNPKDLAEHRDPNCKNSKDVIEKSLQGNYSQEHIFLLKQALELYDIFSSKIVDCEKEIEKQYQRFSPKVEPYDKPLPRSSKKPTRTKNKMSFDLRTALYRTCGVDLTQVDGLSAITVHTVISNAGVDMSRWPTYKHFTSWLRLSPNNQTSGGKVLSTKTGKTKNRANMALRQAAQSLHHSNSYLGAYYRRMRTKLGAPKAITAAAHKLARIIYTLLIEQKEYLDLGADYFLQNNREREIKKLFKKANSLGFYITPVAQGVS